MACNLVNSNKHGWIKVIYASCIIIIILIIITYFIFFLNYISGLHTALQSRDALLRDCVAFMQCLTPSQPFNAWWIDTPVLVACPELLVRKSVVSGLERGPPGFKALTTRPYCPPYEVVTVNNAYQAFSCVELLANFFNVFAVLICTQICLTLLPIVPVSLEYSFTVIGSTTGCPDIYSYIYIYSSYILVYIYIYSVYSSNRYKLIPQSSCFKYTRPNKVMLFGHIWWYLYSRNEHPT